jgi:glucose-6-phosphate isomerase
MQRLWTKIFGGKLVSKLIEDEKRCDELIKKDLGLIADFSRQNVNSIGELIDMIPNDLRKSIEDMFNGVKINTSENRAVLHTALRVPKIINKYPEVWETLERIAAYVTKVDFKDIIVIGIGGSYLGTKFVYDALKNVVPCGGKKLHFVANVDPAEIVSVLDNVVIEKSLFVIVSKTFTTAETMMNANIAKDALIEKVGVDAVKKQMVAVSTNIEKVVEFGIDAECMFPFWDWVGGRFSVWSAVGILPLSLVFGFDSMLEFLRGGHDIDVHFRTKAFADNIPVLMGVVGFNNVTNMGYNARAILPYSAALGSFVGHIQQLSMESNGKTENSGEIIFGEPGTNGQHSFYQLLHQGRVVPCDFIGFIKGTTKYEEAHKELMYNFFAQPDVLAEENRPSTVLLFPQINAYTIGQLLAIYEHQTVVQGFMWGINSFDQPGVALGKEIAAGIKDGKVMTYSTQQMIVQL